MKTFFKGATLLPLASLLHTNSSIFVNAVHRSIEVGSSMDSLRVISILNDIEDINETQEFKIHEFRYLVDEEILDNSVLSDSEALSGSSSSGTRSSNSEPTNSYGIRDNTNERIETPNSLNNTASDFHSCHHRYLRIKFARTADFYGRITIYNLEIFGHEKDTI